MLKVGTLLVVGVFVSSTVSAGPLADAVKRQAATQAQTAPSKTETSKNHMLWPGIILIASGGTLAVLSGTAMKKETCALAVVGFDVVGGCVEETNKPVLWAGIGAAAAGGTLLAIGSTKHQIAFTPKGVRATVKF